MLDMGLSIHWGRCYAYCVSSRLQTLKGSLAARHPTAQRSIILRVKTLIDHNLDGMPYKGRGEHAF